MSKTKENVMNKRNRSIFFAVAAIVVLACACPGISDLPGGGDQPPATFAPISTIPPIQITEEAPVPPVGNVLLQDDFSSDSGEWVLYSEDANIAEVRNGVYVLRSTGDTWAWGGGDTDFTDVNIEVDITLTEGPDNDNVGFGVICHLTENADDSINGYLLAISADGYYYIGNIGSNSIDALVDWEYSDAINLGQATNRVSATCTGNKISLAVNGKVVASTSPVAGAPTFGGVGFAVTSYESQNGQPNATAEFDNLVVTGP
jgi:hypothetical protein